ncbi:MAG: ferritin family protein [Thermodesulfobacteriota bacterium]
MKKFSSVNDVLDFAISREEEANAFYLKLAQRMEKPWMSQVFKEFAEQELRHKNKLLTVKAGGMLQPAAEKVMDLKLADYVVKARVTNKISYQDALSVAMQREKKSFMLYTDLAESTGNRRLRQTFLALAQEEARHKLWVEVQYDEFILAED